MCLCNVFSYVVASTEIFDARRLLPGRDSSAVNRTAVLRAHFAEQLEARDRMPSLHDARGFDEFVNAFVA